MEVCVFFPLTERFLVVSFDGSNLGCCTGCLWKRARILGEKERGIGRHEIVDGAREDDPHVAVGTAPASGGSLRSDGSKGVSSGLEAGIGGRIGDGWDWNLESLKERIGGRNWHDGDENW